MSQSVFPTLNTGTFNPVFWSLPGSKFTREYADLHYLKYPVGQGSQTIPANLNVSGTASLGTLIASGTSLLNKGYLMCNDTNTSFTKKDNTGLISGNNAFFGFACGNNITNGGTNCGFGAFNYAGLTSGSGNAAFGNGTLNTISTTNYNTACGNNAGLSTTGSNNTFIGASADTSSASASNSTAIGYGATTTGSNQVVLGTSSEKVVIPNQIQYNYSSVPTLTTTSIGYFVSSTSGISGNNFDIYSVTPVAGVYIFNIDLTMVSPTPCGNYVTTISLKKAGTTISSASQGWAYVVTNYAETPMSVTGFLSVDGTQIVKFDCASAVTSVTVNYTAKYMRIA
jgi:hypothetical protein